MNIKSNLEQIKSKISKDIKVIQVSAGKYYTISLCKGNNPPINIEQLQNESTLINENDQIKNEIDNGYADEDGTEDFDKKKEYIKNSKYGKQYINSVHSLDNYETQSKIIYYLKQNNRFQLSLEEILLWSNLLQSMLEFIPSNRIKSNTLLKHPVFSCIENEYEDVFI